MTSVPPATTLEAAPHADQAGLQRLFAEQGYVVLRGVVQADRLARLNARILEEFQRASSAGGLFSGGGLLTGHLNCFPGQESRAIYQTLEEHGVIDLVKAISPRVVRAPNVGCNFNLPGSVVQHYHVDSNFTEEFMVVNVATVDTDLGNGAIEVIPGTHRRFYKYWRFAVERPYRASVRLPLGRGDVLVRTSNLWHRGMPNRAAVARPMLAYTWERGGSPDPDPFQAEGGRIAFRPNWYRPNFLGRLRERTYLAAPITYSAYRFARSLVGNKGY
jgi:hypothetical protein